MFDPLIIVIFLNMNSEHIDAWIALREDGTPKQNAKLDALAIFPTKEQAEAVSPFVAPCTISYELPATA